MTTLTKHDLSAVAPHFQLEGDFVRARPYGSGHIHDTYEVVLSVTATTKTEDKTAFIVEVQQAGLFGVKGFPEAELGPLLGAYCPNLLFPYAREVVSDLVTKGSFPQLLLTPVNFDALYAQHLEQLKAGGQGQEAH